MQKLLSDKSLIPAGNLVEVRYEDLDKEPLAQLRKVYELWVYPEFAEAEPAFRAYLDSISGYQKLAHKQLDDSVITKINRNWQFAFDALGYKRIEPAGKVKA